MKTQLLFDRAVKAYAQHCRYQGIVFQQPSLKDSYNMGTMVMLRNGYGTLYVYRPRKVRPK